MLLVRSYCWAAVSAETCHSPAGRANGCCILEPAGRGQTPRGACPRPTVTCPMSEIRGPGTRDNEAIAGIDRLGLQFYDPYDRWEI